MSNGLSLMTLIHTAVQYCVLLLSEMLVEIFRERLHVLLQRTKNLYENFI